MTRLEFLTTQATLAMADGTRIAWYEAGRGPTILLVHPWAMSAEAWRFQVPALVEAGFRCVAFDRRGHGRSDLSKGDYEIDTLADDLGAVIEALDLRDVVLVGHSMGGAEIARTLTRHGAARVAKTVLIAPVTPCLMKRDDNPDGIDPAAMDMLRQAATHFREAAVRDGMAGFFGPTAPPEIVDWGSQIMLGTDTEAMLASQRAFFTGDFRPDMAAFTMPTLVIQGDADLSAPLSLTGARTVAAIRGAELSVYEGAPHGLTWSRRDRVNAELAAFATR